MWRLSVPVHFLLWWKFCLTLFRMLQKLLDQLSKGCLKVEEKLLSATSLTSVSGAMQESTRWTLGWAKSCWKEITLSGGWRPGLPGLMCWILALNTCANSPCVCKSFSVGAAVERSAAVTPSQELGVVYPELLPLLLAKLLAED